MQFRFPILFGCLCLASLAVVIAAGLDDGSRWRFVRTCDGRDVFTYYYAVQALLDGFSPYDRVALYAHFGQVPTFVYPLFTLPVFLPLAPFDLTIAKILFAVLHVLGFIGLILLWRRLLPIDWRLLALLLPVGFGATAIHDLCSGNVVTFEALALWLGILLLWQGRTGAFILWAVLAASFKLLWLALLPLVLLGSRNSWRALALTGAGVLALFGLWLLVWQESFAHWLGNLRVTTAIRYNVFTGLRDIDRVLGGEIGGPLWQRWESWGYALWLVFVALFLIVLIKRGLLLRSATLFAPLTLLAVWPGNLSYSWLIALPSAAALVFFLAGQGKRVIAAALAGLLVLPQPLLFWAGMGERFGLGTLATVLVFWLAFAVVMLRRQQELETWLTPARS
jgi:hypothetical protein